MDDPQRLRRVVEGLRSGIPYQEMAQAIVFGRESQITQLNRLMEQTEDARRPKFPAMVIRAHYGEGKTHLLQSFWGAAADRNWVVSYISLSKETPLDRLDQIYPKIIDSTFVPGGKMAGIESIVDEGLKAPQILAEARAMEFSARVMAILDNLVAHNEGYPELIQDISGTFLSAAELKRIYRGNFSRALKLERTVMREEAFEYLRLVDWLIHRAGYQGWLILFDEVELIGKFGRGARSRAYASIGRLLNLSAPHLLTVWALASNFLTDVIYQRNDQAAAPGWLQSRPKEQHLAAFCQEGIGALVEAKSLEPLSRDQVDQLIMQIYSFHRDAYSWQPPQEPRDLIRLIRNLAPAQDTRLRTVVRLSLTILDIWFQYGVDPSLSIGQVEDEDLAEDQEKTGPAEGAHVDSKAPSPGNVYRADFLE